MSGIITPASRCSVLLRSLKKNLERDGSAHECIHSNNDIVETMSDRASSWPGYIILQLSIVLLHSPSTSVFTFSKDPPAPGRCPVLPSASLAFQNDIHNALCLPGFRFPVMHKNHNFEFDDWGFSHHRINYERALDLGIQVRRVDNGTKPG
jgi:hypothetical protein